MPEPFRALAVDVGASNGRAVLGTLAEDGALTTEEVRRFPNQMTNVGGTLRWDFERLAGELRGAVDDCVARGRPPRSVGVNTWGVDYALFDGKGALVDKPFAYRDHRTDGVMERFTREVMPAEEIYSITGIQFMPINTLYQLAAEVASGAGRLDKAKHILMTPDALAFTLTGRAVAERTIASTSQMLDARTGRWSDAILEKLGLTRGLLPDVIEPGTKVGSYAPASGGAPVDVVAPGGHDTACAVAAIPVEGDAPWAYVSSGTWSLVGVETRAPLLTEEARGAGLTNEGGVEGTVRLLSNVMGLWLIQECMRLWDERGEGVEIEAVCRAAAGAPSGALVDPDHNSFLSPDDMLAAIEKYAAGTSQKPPEGVGGFARCVFESLALKTRVVIERIARLTGADPKVIHIVGGGSRNELLCQMTADATARPVVAGPAEGTATGNLLMQAKTAGRIASLAELRGIVRKNAELGRYEPSGDARWGKMYERFRELVG
jgi:rhamnulokinase